MEDVAEHLGASLLPVQGHERGGELPGHLFSIVNAIQPAAKQARGKPGNALDNSGGAHVLAVAKKLETSGPLLAARVNAGKFKVAGARYGSDTGLVEVTESRSTLIAPPSADAGHANPAGTERPRRALAARVEPMKPCRPNGPGEAVRALYARRFDGLVIIYFDAEGLKRGFQLWLGWPGGVDRLRNCSPIYFAGTADPPGLAQLRARACQDLLVLLCPARAGVFSRREFASLAGALASRSPKRRALIVVFATHESCVTWHRHWPLPAGSEFSLGHFSVSPRARPRGNGQPAAMRPARFPPARVSP